MALLAGVFPLLFPESLRHVRGQSGPFGTEGAGRSVSLEPEALSPLADPDLDLDPASLSLLRAAV